jgi:carbonic anhydrase
LNPAATTRCNVATTRFALPATLLFNPQVSAFERRALIMQQYPSVAILGCSDSRVPIEIVFDQGLGDMFVIRVAGNCLDTTTTASLQYAVQHLHVKLIVVMGW